MKQHTLCVVLFAMTTYHPFFGSYYTLGKQEIVKKLQSSENICLDLHKTNLQGMDLRFLQEKAENKPPIIQEIHRIMADIDDKKIGEICKTFVYYNINLAYANICGANLSGMPLGYVNLSHALCNKFTNFIGADFTIKDPEPGVLFYDQEIDLHEVENLQGARMYYWQAKLWLLSRVEKRMVFKKNVETVVMKKVVERNITLVGQDIIAQKQEEKLPETS